MSVEHIDATAIPQSSFVRRSRILDTKEYKDPIAVLPGIKTGKALRVTLSAETCAVAKNAAFAFKRHLVAHIKESKMKLEVSLRKSPEGAPALYIANPASAK